jgi:hypothetical protein
VEIARGCHKVERYFLATIRYGELRLDWADFGGEVRFLKFMTREEIRRRDNIHPTFPAERTWLDGDVGGTYMGFGRG